MTIETTEIWTPMHDGTKLFGRLFRPAGQAGVLPAVLMRNPYNSGNTPPIWDGMCETLAGSGYAVVNQDVRGTGRSEGIFHPFFQEGMDGYDAVEWVASQPWCNGKVGLWGISYLGLCALHAAIERPPHLVAVSAQMVPSDYYDHFVFENGIANSLFIEEWAGSFSGSKGKYVPEGMSAGDVVDALPRPSFYAEWMQHPEYDDFWRGIALTDRARAIDVPVLLTGGWFDLFANGTLSLYHSIAADRPSQVSLTMAPACHGLWTSNDLYFPSSPSAMPEMDSQWWDHHLKDVDLTPALAAPVRLYILQPPHAGAADEGYWLETASYPPPGVFSKRFALARDVAATDGRVAGRLIADGVSAGLPGRLVHDPANPVPTLGGAICTSDANFTAGVVNQNALSGRSDIATYETEPLASGCTMIGPVKMRFWASSSSGKTQLSVTLAVARPDGTILNILDRMVRSDLRKGVHGPVEPAKADEICLYELEMGHAAIAWKAGMRLQIRIASSNYPRFVEGTVHDHRSDGNLEHTHIFHEVTYPSHLEVTLADV